MNNLKVAEAFCYICRGVLIEPVTLPCKHVFCLVCFEQSMQETSYSCPLCRRRISNWVRSVKRSDSLVNAALWKRIKEQFAEQVQLKLNGEDDGLDQYIQRESIAHVTNSEPGEVAQEFSKLLDDFRKEQERVNQAEELASKELIVKLKEEEERQLQSFHESNVCRMEEDSILAMKIQEEINKETSSITSPPSIIKKVNKKTRKTVKNFKKGSLKGPMDEFLKCLHSGNTKDCKTPSPEQTNVDRSTSTDSTDSISMETNLFKPIKKVSRTPSKHYPDGRINEISLTKVTPLKLNFNNLSQSSSSIGSIIEGKKIHSSYSAFADTNSPLHDCGCESPTTKSMKFTLDETDSGILKDITLGENNDSNSSTIAQEELLKKKSNLVTKLAQDSYIIPSKIPKFNLGVQEKEDEENDSFDTQDYLQPDSSVEAKLIEEQRRIEEIIMQEKEDWKLAMQLSREWESELKRKPLTRSTLKRTNNISSKKTQQTLKESIATRTRNRK